MKLILASASSRRQKILKDAGFEFEVAVSDVDEHAIRDRDPIELVKKLAQAKAQAVANSTAEPALVIGADTIVVFEGVIREKPTSPDQAREFLQSYRHKSVSAVHGVAVVNTITKQVTAGTDETIVTFGDISDTVIEGLIDEGAVFEWAGGYFPEHPLLKDCVQAIQSTPGSTHGLPLDLTRSLIDELS